MQKVLKTTAITGAVLLALGTVAFYYNKNPGELVMIDSLIQGYFRYGLLL